MTNCMILYRSESKSIILIFVQGFTIYIMPYMYACRELINKVMPMSQLYKFLTHAEIHMYINLNKKCPQQHRNISFPLRGRVSWNFYYTFVLNSSLELFIIKQSHNFHNNSNFPGNYKINSGVEAFDDRCSHLSPWNI